MRQDLLDRLAAEGCVVTLTRRPRACRAAGCGRDARSTSPFRPACRLQPRSPRRRAERVLQNDDARLLGRDLCQAAVQLASQLRPVGLSRRIRVGGRPPILEQRLAGSSPLPVPDVSAGVDRQPVQPGRELRLAPKLLDLDAELRQRLLSRVARILGIAKQMAGELLHAGRVSLAERLESPSHRRLSLFSPGSDHSAAHRQGPFQTGGLCDLTPAPAWQLHLSALV